MKRHADRLGATTDILTLQTMSNQSNVPHNINTITHNNIINFHSTNKGTVFSQYLFLKK